MKMQFKYFVSIIAIVTLVACNTTAQKDQPVNGDANTAAPAQDAPVYQKLSVNAFKQKMEEKGEDVIILDVRTPGEVAGGTIDGAVNINFYDDQLTQKLNELDKDKPVFVFCKAGGRSGKCSSVMKDLGFTEIYDLVGGYGAWERAQ